MYENQFIQFAKTIDTHECGMPLPVVLGGEGMSFFAPVSEKADTQYTIVDASGVPFMFNGAPLSGRFVDMAGNYVRTMFGDYTQQQKQTKVALFDASEMRNYVANLECFRIRIDTLKLLSRNLKRNNYPNGDIIDQSMAWIKYNICGFSGLIRIEVCEWATKTIMLVQSPINENALHFVQSENAYYIYQNGNFYKITETPVVSQFMEHPENLLTTNDETRLFTLSLSSNTNYHVLKYKTRQKYYNVTWNGRISAPESWGSTSGRIVFKSLGREYSASAYTQLMGDAKRTGTPIVLNRLTESEYNTLIACRLQLSVVRSYVMHDFDQFAVHVDTMGERFVYGQNEWLNLESTYSYDYQYSNLLRRYENDDNAFRLLKYTCGTATFDLPFTTERPIRQWLPIWLNEPDYEQKDEVYEKLSGERVVMYATINKKYECQIDYVPDTWHERAVIALSCDYVYVDGVKLTKSDAYEKDKEKYSRLDCGTKITRATWKMVANVTSRNSNN